jgi:hypothetical protein
MYIYVYIHIYMIYRYIDIVFNSPSLTTCRELHYPVVKKEKLKIKISICIYIYYIYVYICVYTHDMNTYM